MEHIYFLLLVLGLVRIMANLDDLKVRINEQKSNIDSLTSAVEGQTASIVVLDGLIENLRDQVTALGSDVSPEATAALNATLDDMDSAISKANDAVTASGVAVAAAEDDDAEEGEEA